jgi:hypothetical protein
MIVDYLQRRSELRDRDSIAGMLAQQIARKMEDYSIEKEVAYNARRSELFLEQVARAFEVAEKVGE